MPTIRRHFGITIRTLEDPSAESARLEGEIRKDLAMLAEEIEGGVR
jgi:hypothetical protein